MTEQFDCALLSFPNEADWPSDAPGRYAQGRLQVQLLSSELITPRVCEVQQLRALAMPARRFDVCVLAITYANLSLMRRRLAAAQSVFRTPIFAMVGDFRAAALQDLLRLGVCDFLTAPLDLDVLRVRTHMLKRHALATASEHQVTEPLLQGYATLDSMALGTDHQAIENHLCATILHQDGATLGAYAAAVATHFASSKASFQSLKATVIGRFEQAYIRAALAHSQGNITMAARAAQKHRRAFWALMQKHNINADTFRSASVPDCTS